jgi:hypothetical protein
MIPKIPSILLVLATTNHIAEADVPSGLQLGAAPDSERRRNLQFGGGPNTYCSSNTPNFAASGNASTGQCLNFSRGGSYQYPQDFLSATNQPILNEVQQYVCPSSQKRVIVSNNIPNHFHRQGNPNAPCEQMRYVELPLNPTYVGGITEVPPMGMIAIATNGVAAYGALEGSGGNALDPNGQFVDASFWYGHAAQQGEDHYHNPQMGVESASRVGEDNLLAYALDGFPIYGFTTAQLDECNGRFEGGEYRYHVTHVDDVDLGADYCGAVPGSNNWNYILGCYHGDTRQTRYGSSVGYVLPSDCVEVGGGSGSGSPSPPAPAPPVAPQPTEAPQEPQQGPGGQQQPPQQGDGPRGNGSPPPRGQGGGRRPPPRNGGVRGRR